MKRLILTLLLFLALSAGFSDAVSDFVANNLNFVIAAFTFVLIFGLSMGVAGIWVEPEQTAIISLGISALIAVIVMLNPNLSAMVGSIIQYSSTFLIAFIAIALILTILMSKKPLVKGVAIAILLAALIAVIYLNGGIDLSGSGASAGFNPAPPLIALAIIIAIFIIVLVFYLKNRGSSASPASPPASGKVIAPNLSLKSRDVIISGVFGSKIAPITQASGLRLSFKIGETEYYYAFPRIGFSLDRNFFSFNSKFNGIDCKATFNKGIFSFKLYKIAGDITDCTVQIFYNNKIYSHIDLGGNPDSLFEIPKSISVYGDIIVPVPKNPVSFPVHPRLVTIKGKFNSKLAKKLILSFDIGKTHYEYLFSTKNTASSAAFNGVIAINSVKCSGSFNNGDFVFVLNIAGELANCIVKIEDDNGIYSHLIHGTPKDAFTILSNDSIYEGIIVPKNSSPIAKKDELVTESKDENKDVEQKKVSTKVEENPAKKTDATVKKIKIVYVEPSFFDNGNYDVIYSSLDIEYIPKGGSKLEHYIVNGLIYNNNNYFELGKDVNIKLRGKDYEVLIVGNDKKEECKLGNDDFDDFTGKEREIALTGFVPVNSDTYILKGSNFSNEFNFVILKKKEKIEPVSSGELDVEPISKPKDAKTNDIFEINMGMHKKFKCVFWKTSMIKDQELILEFQTSGDNIKTNKLYYQYSIDKIIKDGNEVDYEPLEKSELKIIKLVGAFTEKDENNKSADKFMFYINEPATEPIIIKSPPKGILPKLIKNGKVCGVKFTFKDNNDNIFKEDKILGFVLTLHSTLVKRDNTVKKYPQFKIVNNTHGAASYVVLKTDIAKEYELQITKDFVKEKDQNINAAVSAVDSLNIEEIKK
jgi:hypothetical protein